MKKTDTGWRPAVERNHLAPATIARWAGWLMLSIGVLLAGFFVYEMFITSFFAGRAQAGLTDDLNQRIFTAEVETVAFVPGDLELVAIPLGMADDVPMPSPAAIAATLESSAGFTVVQEAAAGAGPTPATEVPAGLLVAEPAAAGGGAIGRIEIASIGLDWTVVEGVTGADLRKGAGHMPDTAMPGQPGNAVISGHRTTYGAPFGDLGQTHKGDLITVTTATGSHVYQIVEKRVVQPNETWVTGQWQGSWLTLTTCNPKFSARERLIVFARLVAGPNAATLAGGA
ncbi:MAG: sortase [Acidimicrobiia bacterium]|nr:sortase [Acidimicrobiia bacterium]